MKEKHHATSLLENIKNSFQQVFEEKVGRCNLWQTQHGLHNEEKRLLDDYALYILKVERFHPDLMGYVSDSRHAITIDAERKLVRRSRIIVEVKEAQITLKDIYQTKSYAEIFMTDYAFLISTHFPMISEERKRFLLKKPHILYYARWSEKERWKEKIEPKGFKPIFINTFNVETKLLKKEWFPTNPLLNL